MRFRQWKNKIIEFWLTYYDIFNLVFMGSLIIIVPLGMFHLPDRMMSPTETLIKGLICSLNGMTIGLLFAKYIYNKRIEAEKVTQLEREMQMLLRFRETIAEITRNHRITVSEAYGYQNQHPRTERTTRFSDKKPS